MHSRLISNSNDRWKGIEDVDVKMVIFYVILSKGKNIVQVEIYDEETFDEYLWLYKCNEVYKYKYRRNCLIYGVKYYLFDAFYIGNTYHTFKKIMEGHFSDDQFLLKNGQKSDSFVAHF